MPYSRRAQTKKAFVGPTGISQTSNFMLSLILGLLALVIIMPLVLVIIVSFSDEMAVLADGFTFFPRKLSLAAYEFLFAMRSQLLHSYLITIFVTVTGTVLSLLTISFYAYVISRKDFKYRGFCTFFVAFTILFNGGLVPWYLVSTQVLHLQDRIWGLIFPYLVDAWWLLILRTNFMTSVPDSLIESAKIDGAGELRIFFSIVVPLARPALATIGLFSALRYWNDWWLSLILINDPRLTPLQLLLYRTHNAIQYLLQNAGNITGGLAGDILAKMPSNTVRMAMCVIGIAPILIVFPFFQRHFVKGLTVGAIKG